MFCLTVSLWSAISASALGAGLTDRYLELVDPRTYQASTYQIQIPDFANPHDQTPVVVIFHDAGGKGTDITGNEGLVDAFVNQGYAVIAPDALPRRNVRINYRGKVPSQMQLGSFTLPFSFSKRRFFMTDSYGNIKPLKYREDSSWYFYNIDRIRYSTGNDLRSQPVEKRLGRDEIQNLRNVLANAEAEYGTNPAPAMVIGLGHGGSLVWQIACYAPKFAPVLAPVGGAFWRNIPKNCRAGANLIHTHHRSSAFWPLEGVSSGKRKYARTSIYENLEMLLRVNRCGPNRISGRDDEKGQSHTVWADCAGGGRVEFMIMDDAFDFQTWWVDEMLERFEVTGAEPTVEAPEVLLDSGPAFRKAGEGLPPQPVDEAEEPATRFKRPGSEASSRFKRPSN
jgi:poly(3-hydroxybutyrate) depolymerase